MNFMRYILKYSESNMYILMDGNNALIIDPNISHEALEILRQNGVCQLHIILTHEHFDHASGVNWYKQRFETKIICQRKCAERIIDAKNNRPFVFFPMVENRTEEEKKAILSFYDALPTDAIEVDIIFDDYFSFEWRRHNIFIKSCPGHSPGSSVVIIDDEYAFTGDYMIPNVPVILRFPGGSKTIYNEKTLPFLLGLKKNMVIMPGHGNSYLRKNCYYRDGVFKSGDDIGKEN